MSIRKLCKQLFLFTLFLTLTLQLGSIASWFLGPEKTVSVTQAKKLPTPLPLGLTTEQLKKSLAQFTTDGIVTPEDITAFVESATRGAALSHTLFFGKTACNSTCTDRKEHLRAITDLISFFYLIAMLTRDDGLMPADVSFGIVDSNNRYKNFTRAYLDYVRDHKKLAIGSERNIFGTNHLAYYRQQSHGFVEAWGINLYLSKNQPYVPLLFTGRWQHQEQLENVSGPLYHLLVGTDQHQKNKLYLKPEECGIYYWGEWLGHTKGYLKVIARRTPLVNHLLDTDDDPPFNKERLPRTVLAQFKTAVRAHGGRLGSTEKASIRRGIAGMYEYACIKHWDEFIAYIETSYTMPHYRRGNEIIIAPETAIWSAYFVTRDPKVHWMFDTLLGVKRALATGTPAAIRTAIRAYKQAYGAVMPRVVITGDGISSYLERLTVRFDRISAMADRALAAFVGRHGKLLFA